MKNILNLLHDNDQLILQKDGSGRIDRLIGDDVVTIKVFNNYNNLINE